MLKLIYMIGFVTLTRSQSFQPSTTTEKFIENVIKDYIKPDFKLNQSDFGNIASVIKDASAGSPRMGRSKAYTTVMEVFNCAVALDASCLVDKAENFVDNANNNLLKQADLEARKMTFGRSKDEQEYPSSLVQSIAQLMLDVPELLKEGVTGLFRGGKEEDEEEDDDNDEDDDDDEDSHDDTEEESDDAKADDDDDNEDEDEENDGAISQADQTTTSSVEAKDNPTPLIGTLRKKCSRKKGGMCIIINNNGGGGGDDDDDDDDDKYGTTGRKVGGNIGGGRGKKKKKKKEALIKLLIVGLLLKAKVTLLLKLLAAKLQLKFLFIALANLFINLARFWWDLKKGHDHQPQKVIYYEHAQHQHHYDGAEEWESPGGGGGGYWARAYDGNNGEDTSKSAQEMAYAKQVPAGMTYTQVDDKPNYSWNVFG